jgi:quinohemoprotein ethanol dehydrogenase
VPGNPADGFENAAMEMAAKTWNGEWWEHGGGGTVWDSFAYDPELDLLYIGVGNGSPWNQNDPQPGRRRQPVPVLDRRAAIPTPASTSGTTRRPGETWDYTATQHMILADLDVLDRRRARARC